MLYFLLLHIFNIIFVQNLYKLVKNKASLERRGKQSFFIFANVLVEKRKARIFLLNYIPLHNSISKIEN